MRDRNSGGARRCARGESSSVQRNTQRAPPQNTLDIKQMRAKTLLRKRTYTYAICLNLVRAAPHNAP
ncbi:unnamed protein product [Arctia plantaginis]|uniref:Uncharacterized protein n=1 Tax=Arctia plantaginis TaxID=874455 RepID=A0A8S0Z2G3_ARCPL|nr:unnamed protein product [Arctia plantaginis]